ncbi:hypothetical protein [Acinetobacter baumannii]|uniref:hypothetical protein n=1 Tax=Acinetobacter baumannii TaxID=470 RepID=UPI0011E6796E|nr:hypothetical protein [Acinetobacter baumannii]TYO27841.1 hypothetical protein FXF41_01240 [Acinetobacter baumannii]
MKFEELKNLLANTGFYKVENAETYVALDDIDLKFHLINETQVADDSRDRTISAIKNAFRQDMHSFKISVFQLNITYNVGLVQSFDIHKISGFESYTDDKLIELYFPIQNGKLIYTPIPEDDIFRRAIIRNLNSKQAFEILSESFSPSII